MGKCRGFAADGPQAKALVAVERGRAQPAVVEAQDLAAADFQEQLAIIGTGQRLIDDALGPFRCDLALFENRLTGGV